MPFKKTDCLKDINLLEITKEDKFLRFRRDDMRIICKQILEDVTFMSQHNLLDYSLLLITEENPEFKSRKND